MHVFSRCHNNLLRIEVFVLFYLLCLVLCFFFSSFACVCFCGGGGGGGGVFFIFLFCKCFDVLVAFCSFIMILYLYYNVSWENKSMENFKNVM